MGLSMLKGKVVMAHKPELIDGEPENPRNICRPKELERCIGWRGKGHVCRKLM